MSTEISGFDETQAKLEMLAAAMREEIVADAVFAAAEVIADAEKRVAPVLDTTNAGSDELRPGEMRESIKVRRRNLDRDGFAVAKIGPAGRRARHAAHLVEYGHRLVKGSESKGNAHVIGQVEAYPFVRPAYEGSVGEAIETFKDKLRDGIGRELK